MAFDSFRQVHKGQSTVFKATATVATGTLSLSAMSFTLKDSTGTALKDADTVTYYDTTPAASMNVEYLLDTSALSAGFYSAFLSYTATPSGDSVARAEVTEWLLQVTDLPSALDSPALLDMTPGLYQQAILGELSQESNARLANLLTVFWQINTDKGSTALQYLYTKRQAIDALLGGAWQEVDVREEDEEQRRGQIVKNLQMLRGNVMLEIKRLNNNLSTSTPTTTLSDPFINLPTGEFG